MEPTVYSHLFCSLREQGGLLLDCAHPRSIEFYYFPSGDGSDRGVLCRRSGDHAHILIFSTPLEGEEVCSLTARVQRGPSESARCASKGSNLLALPFSLMASCPPLGGRGWSICSSTPGPCISILDRTAGTRSPCI